MKTYNLNDIREGGKYFLTLKLKHDGVIYKLPNEPLISLSRAKNIKETPTLQYHNLTETNRKRALEGKPPVKNRVGTVKEFININDYKLTIRGVCVNEDNPDLEPTEQIKTLNKLAKINSPLEVVGSKFLTMFNIYEIVIKDIHFDEMIGKGNMQNYVINAISNEGFFAEQLLK